MKEGKEWTYSSLSFEDIQNLKTPFLFRAMTLFSDWKVFETLPHGLGTSQERATVIEALKILNDEMNQWDAWEREKKK